MADILNKTDEELSVLLMASDYNAMAVLIDRYQAPLSRYLRRIGVHKDEDIQDLLQDIFIKIYKNINSFNKDLSFSSWVYRISHNEAISFFRHKKARPEGNMIDDSEEMLFKIEDESVDLVEEVDQTINAKFLQQAILDLEQKYKDVLVLRYFEDRDYENISDILQIPKGSVATLISRAKERLRQKLKYLWLQNNKEGGGGRERKVGEVEKVDQKKKYKIPWKIK
jgi:RNA polymerase sigma-70 factor (ECF subfamily)